MTRLFRLFRLPKLVRLIDISRINQLLKSFFENSSRDQRIVAQQFLMYAYKIFRLIIIALIITYFIGCLWYTISSNMNTSNPTFINYTDFTNVIDEKTMWERFIISWYFALTTLSTVGYGDYYPVSDVERIWAVAIMLGGVAFFSYIMGSFIDIIQNYNMKMGGNDEKSTDLNNWLTLLTRFTGRKPLSKNLVSQIEKHFVYYWANDRKAALDNNEKYLNALPKTIKRSIMTNYLFDDILWTFRHFFNTEDYKDTKFIYDITFGFMPRRFEANNAEDMVIYNEECEVAEMYFFT